MPLHNDEYYEEIPEIIEGDEDECTISVAQPGAVVAQPAPAAAQPAAAAGTCKRVRSGEQNTQNTATGGEEGLPCGSPPSSAPRLRKKLKFLRRLALPDGGAGSSPADPSDALHSPAACAAPGAALHVAAPACSAVPPAFALKLPPFPPPRMAASGSALSLCTAATGELGDSMQEDEWHFEPSVLRASHEKAPVNIFNERPAGYSELLRSLEGL